MVNRGDPKLGAQAGTHTDAQIDANTDAKPNEGVSEGEEPTQVRPPEGQSRSAAAALEWVVSVLSGSNAGRTIRLSPGTLVIGRSRSADLTLDDDALSRKHASISLGASGVVVRDLDSTNGTHVGGRPVVGEAKVAAGARIELGDTLLRLEQLNRSELDTAIKLYESSARDFETGVYNARHFEERLANEVAFTMRHRAPLSLAWISIDGAGTPKESTLRDVAVIVCNTIRAEDFVARVSPCAFGLLLRETESRGANILTERIRHLVRRSSGDDTSVSVGVASFEVTTHFENAEALLTAARDAAARATAAGGDVVINHDASQSIPPPAY